MKFILALLLGFFVACTFWGCASDMTARGRWFTIQQKGTMPKGCSVKTAPDTNTNSMFGPGGAVPER